jgi:hypothetical protein
MTNSPKRTMRPFLFRFAQPLPLGRANPLRHDRCRPTSQAFGDGVSINVLEAPANMLLATRITKIAQETTDDE